MTLVNLRLVATKRHVGLGQMVMAALVLAACRTAQTTPTTTSTTTVKTTSAGAVARFLADAARGDNQTFVASCRYIGPGKGPHSFEFAQQPGGPGSEEPFRAGDFVYLASQDEQTGEFIQRDHGDYKCFRTGHGPWSCDGPNPNINNGNFLNTEYFSVQTDLAQNEPTPPASATISCRTLNGLKLTCLVRYRYLDTSRLTTWCITADGITAFRSSTLNGTVEITRLSPAVNPGLFSLPARPTPWRGWDKWPW
ncbi:MAG: hypothetical protein ACLPUG_06835 [Acidimicrobiales bacterium]